MLIIATMAECSNGTSRTKCSDPTSPCSSAPNAQKTTVRLGRQRFFRRVSAIDRSVAVPEALSSAPG